MLIAYEDLGLQIKDDPIEETRVPFHPIKSYSEAKRILAEAERQRPDVLWSIAGDGPYGVHGQAR